MSYGLFPEEQKGCRKKTRGTGELLYTEYHILNMIKTRRKNLAIDYKKAYNMFLQSWIINCLKMYKILDEVINFIEKTMGTLRVELTSGGKSLPSKDPESYIPRRCTITISICNSDDATQPHTQKMHSQIQT